MGCGNSVNTQDPKNKKFATVAPLDLPAQEENKPRGSIDNISVVTKPDTLSMTVLAQTPRRTSAQTSELEEIIGNNVPKVELI